MSNISVSDAIVAMRSFPRRYRELVGPPGDDDSWDRLVRTVGRGQARSALGWTARSGRELAAFGNAISALPTHAIVRCHLRSAAEPAEVSNTTSVLTVLQDLTSAATMAAVACEARSSADWDRMILLDGIERSARDVLGHIVQGVAERLTDVRDALDAARG